MYINNDAGLTVIYFMARSNLVPLTYEWELQKKDIAIVLSDVEMH